MKPLMVATASHKLFFRHLFALRPSESICVLLTYSVPVSGLRLSHALLNLACDTCLVGL